MGNIINCTGMNCPLPVINTKKYFDSIEQGCSTTMVDNEIAKNNVIKFAESNGFVYKDYSDKDIYYIEITKSNSKTKGNNDMSNNKTLTIVVGSDKLGNGDDALGEALMKSYMFALSEASEIPNNLLFLNSGVRLVIEDSLTLDSIKKLKDRGVNIQSCGLCLDFYKIKDKVAVGEITNMYAIIEMMNNSNKTIKL